MGNVFSLEILSPTHIGNGNTLKPMDLGEHNSYIYIFYLDRLIEKIPEGKLERLTDLVANFGGKNKKGFENLGELITKELNIKHDQWEKLSIFKVKKRDRGRTYDIYEEIKCGNQVYIPGSSIKGAIRTAVVYTFLKMEGYKFSVEQQNGVKYLQMVKPNGKKVGGLKDGKADLAIVESEIKKDMLMDDATKDIFKCLQVSDSSTVLAEDYLEVRKVYVANTTIFTKRRNGRTISMHPLFVECIKAGKMFNDIKIKLDNYAIEPLSKVYKDEKHKFEKIIDLIKNWDACLKDFSKQLIESEICFWENNQQVIENNIKAAYENSPHKYILGKFRANEVIKHLKDIKQKNQILIRLGKYSGYLTHSIGLLLAEDISRNLYNLREFGEILSRYNHPDLFPLTRRLTLDNQTLGWCRLVESNNGKTAVSKRDEQVKPEKKQGFNKKEMIENFKTTC